MARVAWTPAAGLSLVAAAAGHRLLLLNPGADIGAHKVAQLTDDLLEEPPPQHDVVSEYARHMHTSRAVLDTPVRMWVRMILLMRRKHTCQDLCRTCQR